MNVLQEKDNALFGRKEVVASFVHADGPTPSRKQVWEELAKKYGSKDLIVIDKVEQKYGDKTTVVYAKIYSGKEKLDEYEQKYRLKRTAESGKPKEEKKA